jgi:arginine repressor
MYYIEEQSDFNSNKATYSRLLRDLERIKEVSSKKPYYFKIARYQNSEFKYIERDLQAIDKMGKLINNSNYQTPLTVFNTENFGVFEYREKL